jgi:acyl carrier protein
MNHTDVFDGVKDLIHELTGVEKDLIVLDAMLNDLNLDSLSMVELIIVCEERFGVTIEDDDALQLKTVDDAVSYITTQLDALAKAA